MGLTHIKDVSPDFKEKIIWWVLKLNNPKLRIWDDKWLSFMLCWVIFDSYLTEISKSDTDKERLLFFLKEENSFRKAISENPNFIKEFGSKFKNLLPVYDMRPNHSTEFKEVTNEDNLDQVINFVYQIRCNLFHGAKNIRNHRDAELVSVGERFLRDSIALWVHN